MLEKKLQMTFFFLDYKIEESKKLKKKKLLKQVKKQNNNNKIKLKKVFN